MDLKTTIDVGDNVTKLIEKLSDQIGVTADKVFPWYIKNEIFSAYSEIFSALFLFIIGLILYKINWKKSDFENMFENLNIQTILVFVSFVLICAGFIGICFIPSNIIKILNPEYYALNSLIKSLSMLR